MQCTLFNRNTKILNAEYDISGQHFVRINEIYNIAYAPVILESAFRQKSDCMLDVLNKWFLARRIPDNRENLSHLLSELHISSTEELLDKAYGLSLSDQYWFKDVGNPVKWDDINFFHNDFSFVPFSQISLDSSRSSQTVITKADLAIPDGTTDGALKKAWIIENGIRKLAKTGTGIAGEEPFNEWLASQVSEILGFSHTPYELGILNNQLVSKCPDFIHDDEEMITANDILSAYKKPNGINSYEFFINILESKNVKNARKDLENMFLLDCILMNEDRHVRNFGVIRNVETLQWLKVAPIFDTGFSMQANRNRLNTNFEGGAGKFFENTSKPYSAILDTIKPDLKNIDFSKLMPLAFEYQNQLQKYSDATNMSDARIASLSGGFQHRINWITQYQKQQNVPHRKVYHGRGMHF